MGSPPRMLFLYSVFFVLSVVDGARFAVNGPVLTITLKDPLQGSSAGTSASSSQGDLSASTRWLDVSELRPHLVWGIQSQQPPLPNWMPSLTGLGATVGYQYTDLKTLPSWVEGTAKFSRPSGELQLEPSYEVRSGRTNLLVRVSRGASYALARLGSQQKNVLESVRASVLFNLPYASVSSIRLTPSIDFAKQDMACVMEAVTGGSARTKAVLNLQYLNPTLAVVHSLDDRNTIAPEISLYNAKIIYQWTVALGNGSSLRTKVDPTSSIHVTWTDQSAAGGSWVTDCKLPLEGTGLHALAADVRVRRQFRF
jgi:hypothetical protein